MDPQGPPGLSRPRGTPGVAGKNKSHFLNPPKDGIVGNNTKQREERSGTPRAISEKKDSANLTVSEKQL